MPPDQKDKMDAAAREGASEWLSRINRGLRNGEGADLRQWLEVPLHREAIVECARLWWGPMELTTLSALFPLETVGVPKKRRRVYQRLAAAFVAIVSVGASALLLLGNAPWSKHKSSDVILPRSQQIFATGAGETRQITMADGTIFLLNSKSRVVVVYWPTVRNVFVPYGEVTFHVRNDGVRPLKVRAGSHFLETMDASANIRVEDSDRLNLIVTSGQVKVSYEGPRQEATSSVIRDGVGEISSNTTVTARQVAQFEANRGSVTEADQTELDRLLSWQKTALLAAKH